MLSGNRFSIKRAVRMMQSCNFILTRSTTSFDVLQQLVCRPGMWIRSVFVLSDRIALAASTPSCHANVLLMVCLEQYLDVGCKHVDKGNPPFAAKH